jgi:hypothetical protein
LISRVPRRIAALRRIVAMVPPGSRAWLIRCTTLQSMVRLTGIINGSS